MELKIKKMIMPLITLFFFFSSQIISQEKDISNPDDVLAIVDSVGFKGKELLDMVESEEVVSVLLDNTDEALLDGAWSVPSFVVDGELFFGQDRLEMLDWRLSGS